MSELDQTKVSVILVSEAARAENLGYLVDGVVTLEQNELDGRRIRSLGIDKLRGFKVQNQHTPFSLAKGRFTFLEEEYENGPPSMLEAPIECHTPRPTIRLEVGRLIKCLAAGSGRGHSS